MDKLPKELLIEIFSYHNYDDLCQLTLTCKLFNDIINNNSTLMDKFHLAYNNNNDINVDLMMKRKYQRIKIEIVNESLMKFLEIHCSNICELTLKCEQIKKQDFKAILTFCSKLKRLNIDIDKIICSDNDSTIPVMKLTLNSLTINNCDSKFFEILQISAKIIRIYTKCLFSFRNNVVNFLRSQKQLKTLELVPYGYFLFFDDSLANADFQLETLTSDFFLPKFTLEYFKKFLMNQKSLVSIIDEDFHRISIDCIYMNILNDFENVKELKIPGPFKFFHSLSYIEKLTIDVVCFGETNRSIDKLFPNVKNLSIHSIYKVKFVENIQKPARIGCVEFKISDNVKTLTVKNVKFDNDSLFDDDVEIKIEYLTIYDSDNINWLIDYFKNDRIKLKSLEIEVKKIKKSQQEFLESLTRSENKKIEKLKIYMPMKLNRNHDYVCDYFMENESDDAKRMKI